MLRRCLVLALLLQAAPAVHFDSNRAWEHLRQIVSMGPRPSGSPAIEQTRQYIKNQLAAVGIAVAEQKWVDDTPAGKVSMVNLIATIPGTRKDRVVFAGHYDTKRFAQFRFSASDGGSSAAFVVELARPKRGTLHGGLLFLDGEEAEEVWAGTTIPTAAVTMSKQRARRLARGMKALVLVDMIGDRSLKSAAIRTRRRGD